MSTKHIYRISFINAGQIYEIYAKKISQSAIFGFIEAEEFIFNTKTTIVVDPAEEKLKAEFSEVKCTYIPMHSIIRIDEVKKEGLAKIHELSDKQATVRQFPVAFQHPPSTTKSER